MCNIDAHRASFVEHLRRIKLLQNEKIIPSNIFNETNESNITKEKIYNPKLLREIATEKTKNFKIYDKEVAKKD